jgi:ankyrin repeat protein
MGLRGTMLTRRRLPLPHYQQEQFQPVGLRDSRSRRSVVNYPAVVQRLLDHGVDPNVQDSRTGQTSLHIAANFSYDMKIRDPQERNRHDKTLPPPSPPSVLELLLDYPLTRCDMNVRDHHGRTPLHVAIATNHHRVIQVLMEHVARDDIPDRWGSTASEALSSMRYTR